MATSPNRAPGVEAYAAQLISAVDKTPETRGLGILLIDSGRSQTIRYCAAGAPYVLIQIRLAEIDKPSPPADPISVRKELGLLGINLVGCVVAWVGVVGTAAIAPETGGASLAATVLLYGGAAAASAQLANSVTRVFAISQGREDLVAAADNNIYYTTTSTTLDVVGLVGAGAAVKETYVTWRALDAAGSSFAEGLGALSRPQRLRLTGALELQGARRVASVRINAVLKQRLMDAFAAAYGIGSSTYAGAVHDMAVYLVAPSSER